MVRKLIRLNNKAHLALALCCVGCQGEGGQAPVTLNQDVGAVTSVALEPYLRTFEDRAQSVQVEVKANVVAYFKELGGPAGVCIKKGSARIIRIDPKVWEELSGVSREALMFHELGHCVLGRTHNEEIGYDLQPVSLMYPALFSARQVEQDYWGYIHELFGVHQESKSGVPRDPSGFKKVANPSQEDDQKDEVFACKREHFQKES